VITDGRSFLYRRIAIDENAREFFDPTTRLPSTEGIEEIPLIPSKTAVLPIARKDVTTIPIEFFG